MTEAEYMSTVETSKEALWLRELVETFSIMQDSVRWRSSKHLWTSSRFSKGKVENGLLGESHVKSQKGRESMMNEAEANFYEGLNDQ